MRVIKLGGRAVVNGVNAIDMIDVLHLDVDTGQHALKASICHDVASKWFVEVMELKTEYLMCEVKCFAWHPFASPKLFQLTLYSKVTRDNGLTPRIYHPSMVLKEQRQPKLMISKCSNSKDTKDSHSLNHHNRRAMLGDESLLIIATDVTLSKPRFGDTSTGKLP